MKRLAEAVGHLWLRTIAICALGGCAYGAQSGAPPSPSVGPPPFSPVATEDIPAHRHVVWRLNVLGSEQPRSWNVAEARAGDVPMPVGWPWKCRFDHIKVTTGVLIVAPDKAGQSGVEITRSVRCTTDGWRTSAGDTADMYPGEGPVSANVDTLVGAQSVTVTLVPCVSECSSLPEAP
jgi:hypothetical protein